MNTIDITIRVLKLTAAVIPLVAATTSNAWQVIKQNSPSEVWSGYAMAVQNKLNEGWHATAVDVNYTAWNNDYTKLAVCLVKKEGAFNIPSKVLYDKTWDQIVDWANDNGYSVVDQEEYLKGGQKRYAAVLHKLNPFLHYFVYTDATTPTLQNLLGDIGGHLVDMDIEENGNASLFGTIHFNNLYSGVTWDTTMTWAELGDYVDSANKRVLDISRRLDGRYCVLFCNEKPGDVGNWTYYGNASWNWLVNVQNQGWRVQKRNSQTIGGVTTYSGVLVRK